MIYLIGTHHELQHTGHIRENRADPKLVKRGRKEFREYLREMVLKLSPGLVAEELSQDLLSVKKGESIAGSVAKEYSIKHRMCDPGIDERTRRGFPIGTDNLDMDARKKQFDMRERYWLECISDRLEVTVLFVCGADHISSFLTLLEGNGYGTKVPEPYWGKEIYGISETDDEKEVLEGLKSIAVSAQRRSYATFFHASNKYQEFMEIDCVRQWAKVMNRQSKWNIRNIRKNPNEYPDCLADFGPERARGSDVIGVEVTELVDSDAIRAHQEADRLARKKKLGPVSDEEWLGLEECIDPEWHVDKFEQRLQKAVLNKDQRTRDHSLRRQFLLIVTDEPDLDRDTVANYLSEVSVQRPQNLDAVYLMLSYTPDHRGDGHYPVFEISLSGI